MTHPLIHFIAETGSTNDDAMLLAGRGFREGEWLRAERQSGGRGRQGRGWRSPPGNLYASTLVRLSAGDPPAATLALVAAVALHDVARRYAQVTLKWPNDLLARLPGEGWAKLAGILLERADDAVVIGFGVNLASAPSNLDRPVAALAALGGNPPDAATFNELLAESFGRWLSRWRGERLPPIRAAWLAAAHPIGAALATSEGEGLFDGLDENGSLRLRLADGSTRVIHAGDVFLLQS